MIKKILIILILSGLLLSRDVFAVDFETFYFESQNNIKVGEEVQVKILMKNGASPVNGVSLEINFDDENIQYVSSNDSGSVITNWVLRPTQNGSSVKMEGIIPGGIVGTALPEFGVFGDTEIVTLIFKGIKEGESKIIFNEGSIYLSDGMGTVVNPFLFEKTIRVSGFLKEEQKTLSDVVPPAKFEAKIIQHKNIAEGKFVLIFDTYDTASGLSHFEVSEDGGETFVPALSPYVLSTQSGKGNIIVRAYDNAGNFSEVVVSIPDKNGIVALLLVGAFIIVIFSIKYRRRIK
ncbi:MAG: hypothetical protein KBD22_02830 [Candidatus Pacebacteria bacterium]|nr:hypothetical protein [Candidatus Paceibacterota bacterium]MBP9770390.1 hypothetical protein [Candidatus Paceibacterota bacterium]